MKDGLRLDDLRDLLPDMEELAPLLDEVAGTALPDPRHRWASSGELETMGRRLVQPDELEARIPLLVEAARARAEALYTGTAAAIRALSEGDPARAARLLLEVAGQEESRHAPASAYRYAMAAHRLVQGLRDRTLSTLALRRAARAARGEGRLGEAATLYERAWAQARDGGDLDGGIISAIGRGNVAVDRGLWAEGEHWYQEAAGMLGPGDDPRPERWHIYQNLGIVRREQGDLEGCAEALERAGELAGALGDPMAQVEVNNGWGQLLAARGDPAGAIHRFRSALEAARRLEDPRAQATVAVNLSEVLLEEGRLLEAWEAAREAESAALSGRVPTRLPEVYRLLGRLSQEGDTDHAFVFFERALAVIQERHLPEYERALTLHAYGDARRGSGEGLAARGLYQEALRIYGELGMDRRAGELTRQLESLDRQDEQERGFPSSPEEPE